MCSRVMDVQKDDKYPVYLCVENQMNKFCVLKAGDAEMRAECLK